uniref:FTH domain-containing protein n=1 Tax=Steinernema glaseri TaxID=37863 RepID=A0A1I7ZBF0_9BILA
MNTMSSSWDEDVLKEEVGLYVYLINENAVFSLRNLKHYDQHVSIVNLDYFNVQFITIMDGVLSLEGNPLYHPLTTRNFILLKNILSAGPDPCTLHLECEGMEDHPLVQELCLIPPLITEVVLVKQQLSSIETLSPLIERGTIQKFRTYVHYDESQEFFVLLCRFMTSPELLEYTIVFPSERTASDRKFLMEMVETLLTTGMAPFFTVYLPMQLRETFRRRTTNGRRQQLDFEFSTEFDSISIVRHL